MAFFIFARLSLPPFSFSLLPILMPFGGAAPQQRYAFHASPPIFSFHFHAFFHASMPIIISIAFHFFDIFAASISFLHFPSFRRRLPRLTPAFAIFFFFMPKAIFSIYSP